MLVALEFARIPGRTTASAAIHQGDASMKRKMLLRLVALPFVAAVGALPSLAGCDVVADATCPEWEADYGRASAPTSTRT
jgi:hypothetical protein